LLTLILFHHIEISPTATIELGTDVTLRSFISLEVSDNAKLTLGNRVFFNDHCTIRCGKEIEIGKDTMFGDGVRIFDHNHKYSNYHIEKIKFTAVYSDEGKQIKAVVEDDLAKGKEIAYMAAEEIKNKVAKNTIQ